MTENKGNNEILEQASSSLLSYKDHWTKIHGNSLGEFIFKQQADDFVVTEKLSFEPSGEGEHIFLWVEKQNLNTAFVAEYIAKFAGLPLRDVTYAGRKDKFAKTYQWFGLYIANKKAPDWSKFDLAGAKIIKVTRNDRKLRTGALIGNHFTVVLRGTKGLCAGLLESRVAKLSQNGVPNYYGPQRFGNLRIDDPTALPGNLSLAQKMLAGEEIRNRNKRSMAISALRSWLFNEFIHERIQALEYAKLYEGDVMQLAGSNSFFLCENIDETIKKRIDEKDISITCPLWGKGFLHSTNEVFKFEQSISKKHNHVCELLAALGLKQERRAMILFPQNITFSMMADSITLSFELPSGCFATSVLREICTLIEDHE
jgi:tRNA pseudouridine13 synthase